MFDEKEQATVLGGITVQDAWVALQLLDKAASNGVIQPVEYEVLTTWRKNLTNAVQEALGKNYDEEVMKLRQLQAQMAQQAQQAAPAEVV
jgi:hypothetical protein